MPPRDSHSVPGSPQAWLNRARADLALASAPLPPGAMFEDLCYHAQQAAEKALKAVYLRYGWPFRYVHDLNALVTGLREQGLRVPEELDDTLPLTAYALESRYPSVDESVTPEQHKTAVALARRVVEWAEVQINPT